MTTPVPQKFPGGSFDDYVAGLREPAWLRTLRQTAWARYQALDWKSLDAEQWKLFRAPEFLEGCTWPKATKGATLATPAHAEGVTAIRVASQGYSTLTRSTELSSGVTIVDLTSDKQLTATEKLARPALEALLARHRDDKWWMFVMALFDRGVLIDVPENLDTKTLNIELGPEADGVTGVALNLVRLAPRSRAIVVENFAAAPSTPAASFFSATHFAVERDAKLQRLFIQDLPTTTRALIFGDVRLAEKADAAFTILSLGGDRVRCEQSTEFAGEGAQSLQSGVNFIGGRQHLEFNPIQKHRVPGTRSDLLFRSVVTDQARSVFNGNILIAPEAPKTEAGQTNYNLLLSREAQALTLPKLEIGVDDVKCRHGATVSSLDENQIFYLTSRGLPRETAVRMLISGFFTDIFERIPVGSLREQMQREIDERLDALRGV